MGKPLIHQRRGKGGVFKSPSHRFKADARYRNYDDYEKTRILASVVDLVDDPGRTAPLMLLKYETGEEIMIPAPEGIKKGDVIEEGEEASLNIGHILPLKNIPEGYPIFNIEVTPGDGGKLVRSTGTCAFVVSKTEKGVLIKLPSGKTKYFNEKCRATIGCVAGGGRTEKPLLKAGKNYHKMKARNRWYPTVRGVAMNAVDHPHGGKEHHSGKPTTVKKTAPPGRKVGHIGAKRTGRRKR